jgi:PAS domain S-box-containing protein
MDVTDDQIIRQLFDDYLRMYSTRDDRLTTYFSENFSGFTGGGDFLVKDRERWVAITRQDFAQIKDLIRIELKDLAIQSLADTVAVATGFCLIHLPIKDHILSRETARLVLIFRKESEGWKISHSSISIPYNLVREGEIYPLQELTARNRFLEELIDQRTTQLSEAQRIAHLGSWTVDLRTGWVKMSDETCRIKGLEPSSQNALQFQELECLYSPESWARLTGEVAQTKRTGMPYELELEIVRPDGSKGWVLTRGEPERDAMGEVVALHGISMDITERRRAEDALRRSEKLASLGQLAGGIAHDFNNLLMGITMQAELLLQMVDLRKAEEKARMILSSAESAGKLTKKLLAFSRKQELSTSTFDLNQLVMETNDFIGHLLKNIDVYVNLSPFSCWVRADRGQMEQTLINLVLNARDAMPRGGKLVISTSSIDIDENGICPHGDVPTGAYAMIAVADTGHGIPEENLERIFEPFFTTKPKERGTGLGLSIAFGFVSQSGGHIRVTSTVGTGTTFYIYIPSVERPQTDQLSMHALSDAPRQLKGTVLVVDDDALVRTSVRAYLELRGATVLDCADAFEALRVASELNEQLAMLITDVAMPEMTGPELAHALVARMPELPIIFMSGYAAGQSGHEEFKQAKFLQKPFTGAKLLDAVCEGLRIGQGKIQD